MGFAHMLTNERLEEALLAEQSLAFVPLLIHGHVHAKHAQEKKAAGAKRPLV